MALDKTDGTRRKRKKSTPVDLSAPSGGPSQAATEAITNNRRKKRGKKPRPTPALKAARQDRQNRIRNARAELAHQILSLREDQQRDLYASLHQPTFKGPRGVDPLLLGTGGDNAVLGFLHNFGSELGDIAKGTPGALYTMEEALRHDITHPSGGLLLGDPAENLKEERLYTDVVKPQADYYKERYVSPFQEHGFVGGLEDIKHSFYTNPASGLLDVFALASAGTGSAAKAGLLKRAPRAVVIGDRVIVPPQSPNWLTAKFEHLLDDYSNVHPERALVGSKRRGAKTLAGQIRHEQRRTKAANYQKFRAVKRISFNRVKNNKLRRRLYYEAQLAPELRGNAGLEALAKTLPEKQAKKLRAAMKVEVTPAYQEAMDALQALTADRERILLEAGVFTPETLAARRALVGQHVFGEEPTPAFETKVELSPARRAALEKRIQELKDEGKGYAALFLQETLDKGYEYVKTPGKPGKAVAPSDIYIGHVSKAGRKSDERMGGSRVGGGPVSHAGIRKQKNELRLWESGRNRPDPDIVIEDWFRAQTLEFHTQVKQFLYDAAEPIGPEGPKPGWYIVNPEGKATPKLWKDVEDLGDEQTLYAALEDYVRNYIGKEDTVEGRTLLANAPEGVRQVDPIIVHQFFNRLVGPQGASAGLASVGASFDVANSLVKMSLLYANPGYIPANLVGNLLLGAFHQGPFLLPNLVRAADDIVRSPEKARLILAEVGAGPTVGIAAETTRGARRGLRAMTNAEQKIAHIIGSIPDAFPRMAAWQYEARKAGYRTDAQQMRLLKGGEKLSDEVQPGQPFMYLPNSGPGGGYIKKPVTYLRFGDLPKGRSMNHLTGQHEAGLSVYPAWKDPETGKYVLASGGEQYLNTQMAVEGERSASIYRVSGKEISESGDDGEPLLARESANIEETISPDDIVYESDSNLALSGKELEPNEAPDWMRPVSRGNVRDKKLEVDRNQIRALANNAMVDFEVAGPIEKSIVRRIGFVWPWIRGITKWAVREPIDRPVRSALFAHAAEGQAAVNDRTLGDVPSYYAGMFQTDPSQGGPIREIINPTSVSPLSTPYSLVQQVTGQGQHSPGELVNPLIDLLWNSSHKQVERPWGVEKQDSVFDAFLEGAKDLSPIYRLQNELRNPPQSDVYVKNDAWSIIKRRVFRFLPQDVYVKGLHAKAEAEHPAPAKTAREEYQEKLKHYQDVTKKFGATVPPEVVTGFKAKWLVSDAEADLKDSLGVQTLSEQQKTAIRMGVLFEVRPDLAPYQADAQQAFDAAKNSRTAMHEFFLKLEDLLGYNDVESFGRKVREAELALLEKQAVG